MEGRSQSRGVGRSQRGNGVEGRLEGRSQLFRGGVGGGTGKKPRLEGRSQIPRGGVQRGKRSVAKAGEAEPAREGRGEGRAHLAPRAVGRARRGVSPAEVAKPGGQRVPEPRAIPRRPPPALLRPRPRRSSSAEGAKSCTQRLSARRLAISGAGRGPRPPQPSHTPRHPLPRGRRRRGLQAILIKSAQRLNSQAGPWDRCQVGSEPCTRGHVDAFLDPRVGG